MFCSTLRYYSAQQLDQSAAILVQDNRSLTDSVVIDAKVAEAYEAQDFLRDNVVQAKKTSRGDYSECGARGVEPEREWAG